MKTSTGHRVLVIGDPSDGFTSAEIYSDDNDESYLGRIFELSDGWYVHTEEISALKNPPFTQALLEAKAELSHYVNRKGADCPADATRAAVSLWLMQRDDGKGFSVSND